MCICFVSFLLIGLTACGHEHTIIMMPGKDATCVDTGLTVGQKCSTCDKIIVAQVIIPTTSHSYIDGYCYLCDKENPNINVFDKLKYHIKKNGDYSSGEYRVFMKSDNSTKTFLRYIVSENTIDIGCYTKSYYTVMAIVTIDSSLSGYYAYGYTDDHDNLIKGNLVSSTFNSTTYLSHTYADCEGPIATLKTVISNCICMGLASFDMYSIEEGLGLSAKDFGFNSYIA